jgi:hypothetical protein
MEHVDNAVCVLPLYYISPYNSTDDGSPYQNGKKANGPTGCARRMEPGREPLLEKNKECRNICVGKLNCMLKHT